MLRIAFVIPLADAATLVPEPPTSLHECMADSMTQDEPPAVHVSQQALNCQPIVRPQYKSPVPWPTTDLAGYTNWIPVYATSLFDGSAHSVWGRSITLVRTDPSGSL